MTPSQDALLFAFWTGIFAGFMYLWATMLVAWFRHRDNRSLVYVLLLLQLSLISGINSVIRSGVFGLDAYTLVAVQRGIWFAAFLTCTAVADIYNSERNHRSPRVMRWWLSVTHHETTGG